MRSFRASKEQYILQQSRVAKSILHVGCTGAPNTAQRWQRGTLLHKNLCDHLAGNKQRIVGIDIDEPSLKWLKEKMPDQEIVFADAHRLSDYLESENLFDLIIAADVIEHLPNPGLLLEASRERLAPGGRILLTTVNAFGAARLAKLLFNHEAVHSEHTLYFSYKTINRLCTMCELHVVRLGYYKCEPVTTSPSLNKLASNTLEHALATVWPQLSEGLIVEAVGR